MRGVALSLALGAAVLSGAEGRMLHTSQMSLTASRFLGEKEANLQAVDECSKLSTDECASAMTEWLGLVKEHKIKFTHGKKYRCTLAWTCGDDLSRRPCRGVDEEHQKKSCLPINVYRCLIGPNGELGEGCPAMEAIARIQRQKELALEREQSTPATTTTETPVEVEEVQHQEVSSPAPSPPSRSPSPVEEDVNPLDERVSLPETDLSEMTLEEVKEFEEQNLDKMSLLDRLILTNLKQQLEEQLFFCLSTCVVCVPRSVDIEKENLEFVSKAILLQRAKGLWQLSKGLIGAGVGGYVGAVVGGTSGVVNGVMQGSEHGFLSGAWQGVSQGVTGTLSGTGVGTLTGAALVFNQCSANGMVSHYSDGKDNYDFSASRLGKDGLAKLGDSTRVGWVSSWFVDENPEDIAALKSCAVVENKVYDPRTMMKCMSHTSMCGPDSWALPMPVSSDGECKALSGTSAAQAELDVWNLEKQA